MGFIMGHTDQRIELLYKSWENLKSAHDDLDRSKLKLENAELEMETVIFLMEQDKGIEQIKSEGKI